MRVTGPDWESTRQLTEALLVVESDKVINWGQGEKNGLQQLQVFKQSNISCPVFTNSLEVAKGWVKDNHLEVWGRKLHHTQGLDIVLPLYNLLPGRTTGVEMRWIVTRKGNRVQRPRPIPAINGRESWNEKWVSRDFWVQRIPNVLNEYRQHIFNGEAIRRGKKVFNPLFLNILRVKKL